MIIRIVVSELSKMATRPYNTTTLLPTVTLFTKKNCLLCDDAKQIIMNHRHRFIYDEIDVSKDGNEVYRELYKNGDLPVVQVDQVEITRQTLQEHVLLDSLIIAQLSSYLNWNLKLN